MTNLAMTVVRVDLMVSLNERLLPTDDPDGLPSLSHDLPVARSPFATGASTRATKQLNKK